MTRRFPTWVRTSALIAASLVASLATAETHVYVQNNTPFEFVATSNVQDAIASDAWRRGINRIPPGRRELVLSMNRDSGITDGRTFHFVAQLLKDGSPLQLRQTLRGSTVGSHLWQSLAGPGFEDGWFDDRATHSATWNLNGTPIRVLYRAYYAGTDDDVEYILQYAYPVANRGESEFSALAYNVYMRPTSLFKNGQDIRARLLPEQLHGHDVLIFSEAFDDDTRAVLLNGLRAEYPYATRIVGTDRGVEQDGGVIIVSRWPITAEDQIRYGGTCTGSDCQADKGAVYARVQRGARTYHVFGTHTQAWATPEGRAVRARQFAMLKQFIDAKSIPPTEPVLIGGDLNVDRLRFADEYADMLRVLNAEQPKIDGLPVSWDPYSNRLAEQGEPGEYLDYILWSRGHLAPTVSNNDVRIVRSATEWKEFGFETAYWDLSDHYPVHGTFRYEFVGRFDMRFYTRNYLYAVRPDGTLYEYLHGMTDDRRSPEEAVRSSGSASSRIVDRVTGNGDATVSATAAGGATAAIRQSRTASRERLVARENRSAITAALGTPVAPASTISHQLVAPSTVGRGWQNFRAIVPAGAAAFYGITPDGRLLWYRHDGFQDGTMRWTGPVDVGSGWQSFTRVFGGAEGVLYGIGADGSLRWYRHADALDARQPATWLGPVVVGSGWQDAVHAFGGGEGVVYSVRPDGALLWHRHTNYLTGIDPPRQVAPGAVALGRRSARWEGPKVVGSGWAAFRTVIGGGDGSIYAVSTSGDLLWYRHVGWRDGTATWQGPVRLGSVGDAQFTFAMLGNPVSNTVR